MAVAHDREQVCQDDKELRLARVFLHSHHRATTPDIAALPRTNGGLAILDLRMELMPMAAVTVANWAVYGTIQNQVVGDILAEGVFYPTAVYITPTGGLGASKGLRYANTLWRTRISVVFSAGYNAVSLPNVTRAYAFHSMASHFADINLHGTDTSWRLTEQECVAQSAVPSSARRHSTMAFNA